MLNEVFLDNEILRGWKFTAFIINLPEGNIYQGMIAQNVGGSDQAKIETRETNEGDWFKLFHVPDFLELLEIRTEA